MLQKIGGGVVDYPSLFHTTTAEASDKGWVNTGEACNPLLGEAWLLGRELAINSSATMYFTPQVGGVAGVVSGIEVDYYGFMQENLIGTYFSEDKTSSDGTYHSVAVALRHTDIYVTQQIPLPPKMPSTLLSVRVWRTRLCRPIKTRRYCKEITKRVHVLKAWVTIGSRMS